MGKVTENEKKSLKIKFLEFQKKGLLSYGKYLNDQQESASKSDSKDAYKKYIKEQIESNNRRIKEIDDKINS